MKEMPVSYHRILSRLERKEARLLKQKGLSLPMGALEQRIPPSLRSNLEKAFQKAFETMLGPGGDLGGGAHIPEGKDHGALPPVGAAPQPQTGQS